jgi:hypothetical protein
VLLGNNAMLTTEQHNLLETLSDDDIRLIKSAVTPDNILNKTRFIKIGDAMRTRKLIERGIIESYTIDGKYKTSVTKKYFSLACRLAS